MAPVFGLWSPASTLGTAPQHSAGIAISASTARNGGVAVAATAPETLRPVIPAASTARMDHSFREDLPEPGFAVSSAKARAEAAHRAYLMAQIAAGINPLVHLAPLKG